MPWIVSRHSSELAPCKLIFLMQKMTSADGPAVHVVTAEFETFVFFKLELFLNPA